MRTSHFANGPAPFADVVRLEQTCLHPRVAAFSGGPDARAKTAFKPHRRPHALDCRVRDPISAAHPEEAMSESERKKLLVSLEAEFRRSETALAVAQASYEKAYTAMWEYMNEHTEAPRRVLMFTPGVTMH